MLKKNRSLFFQLKRERFVEELENYSKQVEELQEMGNIKELPRYHKKAQHLEQKLTQAAERVRKKIFTDRRSISNIVFRVDRTI